MTLKLVTHADRPDLLEHWFDVHENVWPKFMLQGDVTNQYWGGLCRYYPECQLYLVDDQTDEVVGLGNTAPVTWDGTAKGLTDGVDDILIAAIANRESQPAPTTLCALQAVVFPGHLGSGLSSVIIAGMREVAAGKGFADLIAPVRPNQKSLYPLTPMERYIHWRRVDGLPQDPWLRVHERLGARIMRIAERSMTITGTVAEWEAWTGLAFPESGEYIVTGGLTPVTIDYETDRGVYVEPNVWMRHPVRLG